MDLDSSDICHASLDLSLQHVNLKLLAGEKDQAIIEESRGAEPAQWNGLPGLAAGQNLSQNLPVKIPLATFDNHFSLRLWLHLGHGNLRPGYSVESFGDIA